MASGIGSAPDIHVAGLSVKRLHGIHAGSLRYFDAAEPPSTALVGVLGGPLPGALRAACHAVAGCADEIVLAWRSPTETLLVTRDATALAAVERRMAALAAVGCFIDMTGAVSVWEASGARTHDLLARLGDAAAIPALGEARTSRVAELAVMVICVHPERLLLAVERVYGEHLLDWMSETAADL